MSGETALLPPPFSHSSPGLASSCSGIQGLGPGRGCSLHRSTPCCPWPRLSRQQTPRPCWRLACRFCLPPSPQGQPQTSSHRSSLTGPRTYSRPRLCFSEPVLPLGPAAADPGLEHVLSPTRQVIPDSLLPVLLDVLWALRPGGGRAHNPGAWGLWGEPWAAGRVGCIPSGPAQFPHPQPCRLVLLCTSGSSVPAG